MRSLDSIRHVSFWKEKIIFLDGWFIYMDGKGNNSVISHKCARQIEDNHQRYQARMDVDRGGLEPELAFHSRGFKRNESGDYIYSFYMVDELPGNIPINAVKDILVIPSVVEEIHINCIAKHAFENSIELVKVVFPSSIKEIEECAFADCINLFEVNIPLTQINVRKDAFKNTALFSKGETIYLANTLIKVDSSFSGCFTVREGTSTIADNAFADCSELEAIVFSSSLITIGAFAFKNCEKLLEIDLPDSLDSIEFGAFQNCFGLQKIIFPRNMLSLGSNAFSSCISLKEVIIPEGIQTIERNVFSQCKQLDFVRLPRSISKICFDPNNICIWTCKRNTFNLFTIHKHPYINRFH